MSTPPLTSALRAVITARLTAERDRAAAFSLDAIATELLFIAGRPWWPRPGARTDRRIPFRRLRPGPGRPASVTLAAGHSARQQAPPAAPARRAARQAALLAPGSPSPQPR